MLRLVENSINVNDDSVMKEKVVALQCVKANIDAISSVQNAFVAVVTVSGLFCVHNLSIKESLVYSKDLLAHGYESMKTLGVH